MEYVDSPNILKMEIADPQQCPVYTLLHAGILPTVHTPIAIRPSATFLPCKKNFDKQCVSDAIVKDLFSKYFNITRMYTISYITHQMYFSMYLGMFDYNSMVVCVLATVLVMQLF